MFNIIIPTHNRSALLARTLQSLAAQTFQDFHVIIVDDVAPSAPPAEALAALQGRYTYVTRSMQPGPAESRNVALALVDRPYVMFLDDDDTLEPQHLAVLAAAAQYAQPEILFHDFQIQHEDRSQMPPRLLERQQASISDVTSDSIWVRNRIPNSCLLFRRDILDGVRFDSSLIIYEDWDFLLHCLQRGRLVYLPDLRSVVIHKSAAGAEENMRRGNSRDDLIVPTMLHLYKKFPAPSEEIRRMRQNLLHGAGVSLPLENF